MESSRISVKKVHPVWWHILGWVILFLLPIIFAPEAEEGVPRSKHDIEFFYLNMITKLFWVLMFYINTQLLIPKLFYTRKYLLFILAQFVLFLAIIGVRGLFFHKIVTEIPYDFYQSFKHNIFPLLFTALVSIVFKMTQDSTRWQRLENERKRENLKTELSFLRSQISPHFLFNVLNNIVAMVRLKNEDVEPTIVKLSSLMQYMLYETDEEKVLMKSEVDYLKNYIDLQKIRFGKRLDLNLDISLEEDWHVIEPMLLIPFIENAFKHGTGMIERPIIDISLKTVDNKLHFVVKNKYLDTDKAKDKVSGIGMANVKRRLELLYGNNQQLKVAKTADWFVVTLQLNFENQ